ncbi:9359_t:CDS:2, partial [Funneliformis caledonium]
MSYTSKRNKVDSNALTQFKQSAAVCIKGEYQTLSTICYVLNSGLIPPDAEIPDCVLPYNISKKFEDKNPKEIDCLKKYFQWVELSLVDWASFIIDHPDLEVNPTFAEKVHIILEKSLKDITQIDKDKIHGLFVHKKCISTTHSMKKPGETYIQDDDLFTDLPRINFKNRLDLQNLMKFFGIREVVEIQHILNCSCQENYDHMRIVKYLAELADNLQDDEWKRLMHAKIWPKNKQIDLQNNKIEDIKPKVQLYTARDLYIPLDLYRKFCLPTIEWKEKWDPNTKEAKFLIRVGLQEHPSLEKILELSASPREDCKKALKFFIDNFDDKYSIDYKADAINIAFLPCSEHSSYAKPSECFVKPDCAVMGFNVIHQEYQSIAGKLGLHQQPNHEELFKKLINNTPQTEAKAREIFEYLATQRDEFIPSEWITLSESKFIPTRNKDQPDIIYESPHGCFFKGQEKMGRMEEILGEFFTFINYGWKANEFLQKCGVENEPSSITIADLLVKKSIEIWDSIGCNAEIYEIILRKLFNDYNTIARNSKLIAEMREKPILLGFKQNSDSIDSHLAIAEDIYINDSMIYQEVCHLLTAPKDDDIELWYRDLGCKSLSESIKEKVNISGAIRETSSSHGLQEKLKERAHLFYKDYPKYMIKKDEEWFKKLQVKEIEQIEIEYLLKVKSKPKTKYETAYIERKKRENMDIFTLYVTSTPDYSDISRHIVKNIYKSHILRDIIYIHNILEAPYKANSKQQTLPPDFNKNINQEYEDDLYSPTIKTTSLDPKIEKLVSILQKMFLDCDPDYIRQCLVQENGDQLLVKNKLMEGNYLIFYQGTGSIDAYEKYFGLNFLDEGISHISKPDIIQDAFPISFKSFHPNLVSESQSNYCEVIPGLFVRFLDGIEFYVSKGIDHSNILSSCHTSLSHFVKMLKDLVKAFKLVPKSINVFFDDNTSSIVFNQNSLLFFNFKFYKAECSEIEAMSYWYMMFCHGLAHNFIRDHNFEHR